jgi:ribosomal protein L32
MEVREVAQQKLSKARRRDRRQNPPMRVTTSPLLRAWRNYGVRRV